MTIKHGCNAPRRDGECLLTVPCIDCGYWEKDYPKEDDKTTIADFTTQELLEELVKRDGVKKINLKMTCAQDFRGYDTCIVVRGKP